jgi:chemotaxis phosphatase CheX-like protein
MNELPSPDRLAKAVSQVTSTMLGFSVTATTRPDGHLFWRTAVLSIAGPKPWSVALSSNEAGCQLLGAGMFACTPATVEPSMIDDSLCELVNMTAGQIRALLALDQALGLPRVGAGAGPVPVDQGWKRLVLVSGTIELVLSLINRSY